MKRIVPTEESRSPCVVTGATTLRWTHPLGRGLLGDVLSGCLACPQEPCLTSHLPGQWDGSTDSLCPVDALEYQESSHSVILRDGCVGCGLCVLSCPVGAIEFASGRARVGAPERTTTVTVSDEEFDLWLVGLEVAKLPVEECRAGVDELLPPLGSLRGREFYLFTEKLLRSLGISARASNMGDTSQRTDLIVMTPAGMIPVEIKSATETPVINAKSIQQAVENKLTISRMEERDKMSALSTWVIGYAYPPARVQLLDLVDDVHRTFGIRVGLLSVGTLLAYLMERRRGGVLRELDSLYTLKGIPCDA